MIRVLALLAAASALGGCMVQDTKPLAKVDVQQAVAAHVLWQCDGR